MNIFKHCIRGLACMLLIFGLYSLIEYKLYTYYVGPTSTVILSNGTTVDIYSTTEAFKYKGEWATCIDNVVYLTNIGTALYTTNSKVVMCITEEYKTNE